MEAAFRSFHHSELLFKICAVQASFGRDTESLVHAECIILCSHSVAVSTTDFESVILGSNPSESSVLVLVPG
uniref:Uncharacterized protein n=1 Tax=viral metagenome TaxID=1070528 RepID=A0A6C0F5H9_9ZZZZ